jgi:ubiquinone/menaquinone biosynthesis C-methylase UbiE
VQPNTQQATLWNESSGKAWVDRQPVLDRWLELFEPPLIDAGSPGEGGNVLDIGCGAGATTLAMARRVGISGHCAGLDISQPLVALARQRASAEGLANASFELGDAQTHVFAPGRFDAVISRFGVMFFDDPVAAFANIRRAAKPAARLAFIAWRSPADNDFMTAAPRAARPFLPPQPAFDPLAPGQFAFADGARVRHILKASGWASIDIERLDIACRLPENDLATYITRLGPIGAALRELDQGTAEQVMAAVMQALARFVTDGEARFTAACWLVKATA